MDWHRNERVKIAARNVKEILFGQQEIDISKLEQLVDTGQAEAIGWMMKYYAERILTDGNALVPDIEKVMKILAENGLDAFTPYERMGNFAAPRKQELLGAINRVRNLEWRR
jgi:predicted ABC-class ATPase